MHVFSKNGVGPLSVEGKRQVGNIRVKDIMATQKGLRCNILI